MKKIFIILLLLIIPLVVGQKMTQDYNNPLTRSVADSLYCLVSENCSTDNNRFELYINSTLDNSVGLFLNESPKATFSHYIPTGKKFVIGVKDE